jgi:uncharacterized membrane protein YpjA
MVASTDASGVRDSDGSWSPIPAAIARYYLSNGPSLAMLLVANTAAMLIGLDFYVASLPAVPTFLWGLYADSPATLLVFLLSLATLLSQLGHPLGAVQNRPLVYLNTLAFGMLVKYGLWTAVAVTRGVGQYTPPEYVFLVGTHLGFVLEAYLVPYYGRTTRGALVATLAVLLASDVYDYAFGFNPPLPYEHGLFLPLVTVALSVVAVALASHALARWSPRNES